MPIGTDCGTTEYTTQDVAGACDVCLTRATDKYRQWEQRMTFVLAAVRTSAPQARNCELAEMVLAVLRTGGRLAALDAEKLRRRLRLLLSSPSASSSPSPRRRVV